MSKFVTLNELYHTLEELQTQNINLINSINVILSELP